MSEEKKVNSNMGLNTVDGAMASEPFNKLSPAYVGANEDLRYAARVLQPHDKDVLTVTGSGDHPLLFALNGAKSVDTFDISCFAYVMLALKNAAIRNGVYDLYLNMLREFNQQPKIAQTSSYKQLAPYCDPKAVRAVHNNADYDIVRPNSLVHGNALTADEFAKLSQKEPLPSSFVQTDLADLPKKLDKSYDQMYFSNILEYNPDTDRTIDLVRDLKPFVNKNGTIMLQVSVYFIGEEYKRFEQLRRAIADWARVDVVRNGRIQDMCLVHVK